MRSMFRAVVVALVSFAFVGGEPAHAKGFNDVAKLHVTVEPSTVVRGQTATLKLTVEVAPGYHTYPTVQVDPNAEDFVNKFEFVDTPEYAFVGDFKDPPGYVSHADPDLNVKELREYKGKVTWERQFVVRPTAKPGKINVTWDVPQVQACDESGCFSGKNLRPSAELTVSDAPPQEVAPPFRGQNDNPLPPGPAREPKVNPAIVPADAPETAADHQRALDWVMTQLETQKATPTSSLAFILAGIFWGAVSLVTPCVFPMIPITVSYFLKQADKQHHRPVTMALVYCGTIVIVLTIAAVLLLSVFRYLSTNPYMNVGMGVLFIVFALSLFGMYDLELPSGLARFTSSREGKGGLVGTVFMALTFTIVSFACVAPFLGGFGGTSASSQISLLDRVLGGLAFAATFASPFFVLALFPTLLKKLPRSGTWLNSVKVVMGFLELAAALVFFRTSELVLLPTPVLFTYDFVLGLWIAIAVLCGLYLLSLFRLPHDTPLEHLGVPRMLFGLLFVGLALYLLPALFKTGADRENQRPKGVVYAWVDSFLLPDSSGRKEAGLAWSANLKKTIEEARTRFKETRRPSLVLIDFTGKSCKNCRYNEHNVFTRPEVADLMRKYDLVQLYTDTVPPDFYPQGIGSDGGRLRADAAANLAFQKKAFDTEQLPLYVILDPTPDGANDKIHVVGIYSEGKINDASAFAQFLKEPLGPGEQRAQAAR